MEVTHWVQGHNLGSITARGFT